MTKIINTEGGGVEVVVEDDMIEWALTTRKFDGPIMWDNTSTSPKNKSWLSEYARDFPRYISKDDDFDVPERINLRWGGTTIGFAELEDGELRTGYAGTNDLVRRLMRAMSTLEFAGPGDEDPDDDEYDTGIVSIADDADITAEQRLYELMQILGDLPAVTIEIPGENPEGNVRSKAYYDISKLKGYDSGVRDKLLDKVNSHEDRVDKILHACFTDQVWKEIDEIEKSPRMWRRDDNVPIFVRSYVKEALENRATIYPSYSNVYGSEHRKVKDIIEESLTQPQGWSIASIRNNITSEFDEIDKSQAETIARTEVAAVLNRAKMLAYKNRDVEPTVYWSGPSDSHTTDICEEIKQEINRRGGHVKLSKLEDILLDKALKYQNDGGTPERVKVSLTPHFQCRHTLVRSEFLHR